MKFLICLSIFTVCFMAAPLFMKTQGDTETTILGLILLSLGFVCFMETVKITWEEKQ